MLSLLPHDLQERPLCPLRLSPQTWNPSCPSKAFLSTEEHKLWSLLLSGSSSKQSESLPRYLTLLCPLQVTPLSPVLFPHLPGSLFSQGGSNMKLTSETLRMSVQEVRANQQHHSPSGQRRTVRPEMEDSPTSPGKEAQEPGLNTSSSGAFLPPTKKQKPRGLLLNLMMV